MNHLNFEEYLDKVRGCWAGKNIGGTLGAPMEGEMKTHNVTFYTQELNGIPAPNDDLDLQLIWLAAVETRGLEQLSPRLMGEFWDHIIAPCGEYNNCRLNIDNGLLPPLSGAVNNDRLKYSNGAWIRSEIWACLCPGAPDEAIRYAYIDSCADHCLEGIYAEMFTAALEAAAFLESDFRKLIAIALGKVPTDSKLAAAVQLVLKRHKDGDDWLTVRNAVMKTVDIEDYRAAVNLAFVAIGLLYGDGDFGKSICTAVNCGDDTDCTGATVGAIYGIVHGRQAIPEKWLAPIGESISTICISHFGFNYIYGLPKTLEALSLRVARAALASAANPLHLQLMAEPTIIEPAYRDRLSCDEAAKRIWALPLYYLEFDLGYAVLRVEYVDGPICTPGGPCRLRFTIGDLIPVNVQVSFRWKNLPPEWKAMPEMLTLCNRSDSDTTIDAALMVGEMTETMTYLELEIELLGRRARQIRLIPVQKAGTVFYPVGLEGEKPYRHRIKTEAAKRDGLRLTNMIPQL